MQYKDKSFLCLLDVFVKYWLQDNHWVRNLAMKPIYAVEF